MTVDPVTPPGYSQLKAALGAGQITFEQFKEKEASYNAPKPTPPTPTPKPQDVNPPHTVNAITGEPKTPPINPKSDAALPVGKIQPPAPKIETPTIPPTTAAGGQTSHIQPIIRTTPPPPPPTPPSLPINPLSDANLPVGQTNPLIGNLNRQGALVTSLEPAVSYLGSQLEDLQTKITKESDILSQKVETVKSAEKDVYSYEKELSAITPDINTAKNQIDSFNTFISGNSFTGSEEEFNRYNKAVEDYNKLVERYDKVYDKYQAADKSYQSKYFEYEQQKGIVDPMTAQYGDVLGRYNVSKSQYDKEFQNYDKQLNQVVSLQGNYQTAIGKYQNAFADYEKQFHDYEIATGGYNVFQRGLISKFESNPTPENLVSLPLSRENYLAAKDLLGNIIQQQSAISQFESNPTPEVAGKLLASGQISRETYNQMKDISLNIEKQQAQGKEVITKFKENPTIENIVSLKSQYSSLPESFWSPFNEAQTQLGSDITPNEVITINAWVGGYKNGKQIYPYEITSSTRGIIDKGWHMGDRNDNLLSEQEKAEKALTLAKEGISATSNDTIVAKVNMKYPNTGYAFERTIQESSFNPIAQTIRGTETTRDIEAQNIANAAYYQRQQDALSGFRGSFSDIGLRIATAPIGSNIGVNLYQNETDLQAAIDRMVSPNTVWANPAEIQSSFEPISGLFMRPTGKGEFITSGLPTEFRMVQEPIPLVTPDIKPGEIGYHGTPLNPEGIAGRTVSPFFSASPSAFNLNPDQEKILTPISGQGVVDLQNRIVLTPSESEKYQQNLAEFGKGLGTPEAIEKAALISAIGQEKYDKASGIIQQREENKLYQEGLKLTTAQSLGISIANPIVLGKEFSEAYTRLFWLPVTSDIGNQEVSKAHRETVIARAEGVREYKDLTLGQATLKIALESPITSAIPIGFATGLGIKGAQYGLSMLSYTARAKFGAQLAGSAFSLSSKIVEPAVGAYFGYEIGKDILSSKDTAEAVGKIGVLGVQLPGAALGYSFGKKSATSIGELTGVVRAKTYGYGDEQLIPYKSRAEAIETILEKPEINIVTARENLPTKSAYVRTPSDIGDIGIKVADKQIAKGYFGTIASEFIEPFGSFFLNKGMKLSDKIESLQKTINEKTGKLYTKTEAVLQATKEKIKYETGRFVNQPSVTLQTVETVKLPVELKEKLYKSFEETGGAEQYAETVYKIAYEQSKVTGRPVAVPSPKRFAGIIEPENEAFVIYGGKFKDIAKSKVPISSTKFVGLTEEGAVVVRSQYGNPLDIKKDITSKEIPKGKSFVRENIEYNLKKETNYLKQQELEAVRKTSELYEGEFSLPGEYGQHGIAHAENVYSNLMKYYEKSSQLKKEFTPEEYQQAARIASKYHDIVKISEGETEPLTHSEAGSQIVERLIEREGIKVTPKVLKTVEAAIEQHEKIQPLSAITSKHGSIEDIILTSIERPSTFSKAMSNADRADLARMGIKVDPRNIFDIGFGKPSKEELSGKNIEIKNEIKPVRTTYRESIVEGYVPASLGFRGITTYETPQKSRYFGVQDEQKVVYEPIANKEIKTSYKPSEEKKYSPYYKSEYEQLFTTPYPLKYDISYDLSYKPSYKTPYSPTYEPKYDMKDILEYEPVKSKEYGIQKKEYSPLYEPKYEKTFSPYYVPKYKSNYIPLDRIGYPVEYKKEYTPSYTPKYNTGYESSYSNFYDPKYDSPYSPSYTPPYTPKYDTPYAPPYTPTYKPSTYPRPYLDLYFNEDINSEIPLDLPQINKDEKPEPKKKKKSRMRWHIKPRISPIFEHAERLFEDKSLSFVSLEEPNKSQKSKPINPLGKDIIGDFSLTETFKSNKKHTKNKKKFWEV